MSWKKNRESYVVQTPNLEELIGDPFQNGLLLYHKWCNQLLTIRHTSIALVFFVFGVVGIYVINLPIYLFGLNKIDYLSLSGLWNVICMVSILTVHLYLNSVNILMNKKIWISLLPLMSYPFCGLCCTSFYLQWIGIPFLSSIHWSSSTDDDTAIIIQYSVLLLSYIYGYIPHQLLYCNKIYFKCIQSSRSIYLKQMLKKTLISNLIQSITYSIFMFCIYYIYFKLSLVSSYNMFCILFRITFSINFLYLIGYNIMNRLLTEKVDLGRFNGYHFPLIDNGLHRCIDIRLMALTQSTERETEREYFCYLALMELLDILQFDEKQRKMIYSTQIYFNILVETLLAQYTTFIISLYEYIYGDNKRNNYKILSSSSFLANLCYKYFTLKPQILAIFNNYQILIYSADILSFLIIHSLEEDELGIVQDSLEQILCVLLECLDILDLFTKCNVYRDIYTKNQYNQSNQVINALYKAIETALMRIVVNMYNYLGALKLPPKNAQRLQSYINQ